MSIEWTIDGHRANSMAGTEVPTFERGSDETFEFLFYGSNAQSRYENVKAHFEYIGTYVTEKTLHGKPAVEEFISADAPVSSNIVVIEPGTDVTDVPSMWVMITGGEDASRNPGMYETSLDVTMLAKKSEYADRQTLLDDLSTPLIQL